MAIERTFSIVKPNAVEKNAIGEILARGTVCTVVLDS